MTKKNRSIANLWKVTAELTYVLMKVSLICVPAGFVLCKLSRVHLVVSKKLQVVNTNRSTTVPRLKMESAEAAPVCGSEKGQTGCITSRDSADISESLCTFMDCENLLCPEASQLNFMNTRAHKLLWIWLWCTEFLLHLHLVSVWFPPPHPSLISEDWN